MGLNLKPYAAHADWVTDTSLPIDTVLTGRDLNYLTRCRKRDSFGSIKYTVNIFFHNLSLRIGNGNNTMRIKRRNMRPAYRNKCLIYLVPGHSLCFFNAF